MEGNFKRYVDQRTQNVIAPGSKFSYRSVKIEKSRRVVESRPVCHGLKSAHTYKVIIYQIQFTALTI